MIENKRKRVFADVPASTANLFLATAKMQGLTAQELISDFVAAVVENPVTHEPKSLDTIIRAVLQSDHPVASPLLAIAVEAAIEIIRHGGNNLNGPTGNSAPSAVGPGANQGAAETGGMPRRRGKALTGGNVTG